MKKLILPLCSVLLIAVTPYEAKAQQSSQSASVETKDPNSDYKPAFKGQTRINAVTTKSAYESKEITDGLERPWGIAALPDGRFLVTEKDATMRIVTAAGAVSDALTGIPKADNAGQGGMLGICIDPDFKKNRMVYWVFTMPDGDKNVTAVAKGKLAANDKSFENATVIYEATPSYKGALHFGGRILFTKDGNLLVSTGERSDLETRPQAQDLNSGLGKIVRITTDGKPVAGNPFIGKANARPELYSYGHRNVQGMAIDPVTGDLWETEFGPKGGDELNRVQAGKNYGWPIITYGREYSGDKVGAAIQQKEGLEQPVYYWDPVISPSGITFYSGKGISEWKNNLFISSLSGMHICRVIIKNNKVVGEERLLVDEKQRFRDIIEGIDGALYTITDQGKLYRIGKK